MPDVYQNKKDLPPSTLQSVKGVDIALVSYTDQNGQQINQFAVVGDNSVLLLDNRSFAGGTERTPAGFATGWLKDQVLKAFHQETKAKPTIAELEAMLKSGQDK